MSKPAGNEPYVALSETKYTIIVSCLSRFTPSLFQGIFRFAPEPSCPLFYRETRHMTWRAGLWDLCFAVWLTRFHTTVLFWAVVHLSGGNSLHSWSEGFCLCVCPAAQECVSHPCQARLETGKQEGLDLYETSGSRLENVLTKCLLCTRRQRIGGRGAAWFTGFIGGVWIIDCVEGSGRLQSDLIWIFTKYRYVLPGVIATCGPLVWTKQGLAWKKQDSGFGRRPYLDPYQRFYILFY